MKNIVIGALSTILFLLIILTTFTVYGRTVRTQELNDGLSNAMTVAVKVLMEEPEYAPDSDEEFISDFTQAFLMHINSASNVKLEILDVDYRLGLLSVRATSEYQHLTGSQGTVAVEKTIILEQYADGVSFKKHRISYYIDGKPFKEYELKNNSDYMVPNVPVEFGNVIGWEVLEGDNKGTIYTPDELRSLKAENDVIYIAVF